MLIFFKLFRHAKIPSAPAKISSGFFAGDSGSVRGYLQHADYSADGEDYRQSHADKSDQPVNIAVDSRPVPVPEIEDRQLKRYFIQNDPQHTVQHETVDTRRPDAYSRLKEIIHRKIPDGNQHRPWQQRAEKRRLYCRHRKGKILTGIPASLDCQQ